MNKLENNAIRAKRSTESVLRFAGKGVLGGEIRYRSVDLE